MKIYIVLEENYNMLASENGASYIYGVYDSKDKALLKLLDELHDQQYNCDIVLDEQSDIDEFVKDINNDYFGARLRTFYKYQENWDYYSEIMIKEEDLQ